MRALPGRCPRSCCGRGHGNCALRGSAGGRGGGEKQGGQGLQAGSPRLQAWAHQDGGNRWFLGGEVLRLSGVSLKARVKETEAQGNPCFLFYRIITRLNVYIVKWKCIILS